MTIEQRVARLEMALLGCFALITGEAQAVANNPEELAAFQQELGETLQAMSDAL